MTLGLGTRSDNFSDFPILLNIVFPTENNIYPGNLLFFSFLSSLRWESENRDYGARIISFPAFNFVSYISKSSVLILFVCSIPAVDSNTHEFETQREKTCWKEINNLKSTIILEGWIIDQGASECGDIYTHFIGKLFPFCNESTKSQPITTAVNHSVNPELKTARLCF